MSSNQSSQKAKEAEAAYVVTDDASVTSLPRYAEQDSQDPGEGAASCRDSSGSSKGRLSTLLEKAKAKLPGSSSKGDQLADDEADFERRKAKEEKKEQRKEEYERLGLDKKVHFGAAGDGGMKFQ